MKADFITALLAKFIDKFKAKNPLIFLIIQSALFGLQIYAFEIQASGTLDPENQTWLHIGQAVTLALQVLTGSRTYKYINQPDKTVDS